MRKIQLFFLCLFVFFQSLNGLAQSVKLKKKISLSVRQEALGRVLKKIEKQAGFHFSYGNKYVPVRKKITFSGKNVPVYQVIDSVLQDLGLIFFEVEGEVVIRPGNNLEVIPPGGKSEFTVSGYIKDNASGESLIGANFILKDTAVGTVTNPFGFYSLTLPEGNYEIVISYLGYQTAFRNINLHQNIVLSVSLSEDVKNIQEVVIIRKDSFQISGVKTGALKMKPAAISRIPAFMGEVDVIKSLESIPGITFFGDGSTLFYVRGGNKDQNLILLDDAPIFNPAHLFGFFSNVIPDAIKDVTVYKGDMPASMGGRLSSLIDIRTRDGNMQRFKMSGQAGLVASRLSVEGPVKKDRSSFFLSGRHSYVKPWIKQKVPYVRSLYFTDFNGKLNTILNSENRLFFTLYYGEDSFLNNNANGDASGIMWDNFSGSVRWNHLFGEKLFSNTTLFAGNYVYDLVTSMESNDSWHAAISNTGLKTDFTWYPSPDLKFYFGGKLSFHSINPGNFKYGESSRNSSVPVVPVRNAMELNGYLEAEKKLGEKWLLRAGLRSTLWQNRGPATEYVFDDNYQVSDTIRYLGGAPYHTYFRPEPRLNISYHMTKYTRFNLTYARNVQNLHLITNSVSPFTSLEVWLPSGPNIKPEISDQLSVGYFKYFPGAGVDLSTEAYLKKMQHQIDYEYHAKMLLNPLVEGELRFGVAHSYGLEIMIRKNIGKWTGWLGYAYSKTLKKIKDVYQNRSYPAFYDRPHDLSLFLAYQPFRRWTFSGTWIYTSGAAFTTPTSFYFYQGHTIPVYTEKNNDRLPAYHRLDLEVNFKISKPERHFQHELSLSLYNAYGRKNPISVNFNKIEDPHGNMLVPVNLIVPPELSPSQIWLYRKVPALNYKFSF